MDDLALTLSLIVVTSMLCQWLAWRVRIPAILFLLLSGISAKHFLDLDPDLLFGKLLMPFVSLSVAIILFEGSLTLRFDEIRELGSVVRRLVSTGVLITWLCIAATTHLAMGFSIEISALFGALVVVTGPTVISPLLRSVRPTRRIANILRWEGIVIDPIGALFAVLIYEFIVSSSSGMAPTHTLQLFAGTIMTGVLAGVIAGYGLGYALKQNMLPEYLHGMLAMSLVLITFTISNIISHESGLLAVTIMGIWLGNTRHVEIHHILNFKENLSVLLISVLFITLAARVDLQQILQLGWPALVILVVIQFVARPLKVGFSTFGTDLTWRERALLAWIAPRGIVAAAMSAIFAERLITLGYGEANALVPLTFLVILGTVIFQSATSRQMAKLLDVAEPEASGFLFVGANPIACQLAEILTKQGIRCVLCDSSWDFIRQARMSGLETYYGNPTSEDADRYLDLSGIGKLLAISTNRDNNLAAAIHYRADFGSQRIYSISLGKTQKAEKHRISDTYRGQILFGEDINYSKLASMISRGFSAHTTTLTDEFNWDKYQEKNTAATPLFYITPNSHAIPFTLQHKLKPESGGKIISLFPPESSDSKPSL